MMRVFGLCFWLLAACARPAEPPNKDTLILELGGNHDPLDESLARVRGDRQPAQQKAVDQEAALQPAAQAPEVKQAPPPPAASVVRNKEPLVTPAVETKVQPAAPGRSVPLGDRTLYRIAVEELGSGARWREIAELNGWSEAQVQRLPKGTTVKLPVK